MESMELGFVGGLSCRAIIDETGPAFSVRDALALDAKLVPLHRHNHGQEPALRFSGGARPGIEGWQEAQDHRRTQQSTGDSAGKTSQEDGGTRQTTEET
jgi:hypothetical protein